MEVSREDGYSYLWQSVRQNRACREVEDVHCARYIRPQLSAGFEKTPLDKPSINYLWDDTAIKANELFGRGLWSITHSSAIDWFGYQLPKDLKGDEEGDEWAERVVTDDLKMEFLDGGLYLALLLRLYDVGTFGYGALFSYEDPDRPGHLAYEWVPANECFYLLDGKGVCHTFVRPLNLTAHQILIDYKIEKSKVDSPVLQAFENKNHSQKFLVLHIVERRKDAPDNPKDSSEFAFKGVYFYPTTRKIIGEHGYLDMPYHVLTWGGSRGTPYPMGIGYTTLPEIRNINSTRKRFDRLLEMESDSPVLGPDSGEQPGGEQFRVNPGDFIPNGINGDGKRLYDLMFTGSTGGRTTVNEVTTSRQIIADAWHNQLFMMQTQRQMTAEEVRSRDAKIIQAMGPFIVFIAADMTTICDRTFQYRLQQGAYDPLPQILGPDTDLKLKFDGLLAKAQEALQGGQILQLLQEGMLIAQMGPEGMEAVFAGTDLNAAWRALAGSKSIPTDIVFSKEKYDKEREKRAAAQANAQAMEQAPAMAKAANDTAQAAKGMVDAQTQLASGGVA
jgi:hypothetical protein